MTAADAVLFIPGFFGFDSFGEPGKPIVEYFARVRSALARGGLSSFRFAVVRPPPTGALAERVAALSDSATHLLEQGLGGMPVERLHLIGHSTGGLDARLFANPVYRWEGALAEPARRAQLERIASVTTISAPFHGTPLAAWLSGPAALALPALNLASILATRRQLRVFGQLGNLFVLGKRLLRKEPTPTDEWVARFAGIDRTAAKQIASFLVDVAKDHRLVRDILPAELAPLHAQLAPTDFPGLRSYVTLAPPPGLGLRGVQALLTAPLQRVLYDLSWPLSSAPPPAGLRLPEGPWIGPPLQTPTPSASDGVVPAWSQTLSGRAEGLIEGDHLDVIGHYEAAGATFFRSGSSFDDSRFDALWADVAGYLARI